MWLWRKLLSAEAVYHTALGSPLSVQPRTVSSIDQYEGLADGPHCPAMQTMHAFVFCCCMMQRTLRSWR